MTFLSGRHAVVTGAGAGIGAGIAKALGAAGAQVTLLGRRIDRLKQTAEDVPAAQALTCDVADPSSVSEAFAEARTGFGPISILVNNAGVAPSAPFEKTRLEDIQNVLAINLEGVFLCAQAAISDLKADGAGRLINIASTAGLKGYPYVSAYVASKHAVVGLTRALALEYARKDVTVNAICPGFTDTAIVEASVENIIDKTGRSREEAIASLVSSNPQGRLISVDEVAQTVLWLCQDSARSITGQAIAVAGGEVM